MQYFLIVIYISLFSFLILKTRLFRLQLLSRQFILIIFLLKAAASFLYGYIHYTNGWNDTFAFFDASKMAAQMWPEHPWKYLRFIFGPTMDQNLPPAYQEATEVKAIPYYNLQRSGFIVRANSLIQIFSLGYYSVHCIFFAFLSLIGIVQVYRFFAPHLPSKKRLLTCFLFFTPSILYWTSGAHKDALIILGLGLILWSFSRLMKTKQIVWLILFLITCSYSYFARDYTFLLFVPALLAYAISDVLKSNPLFTYGSLYALLVILFFGLKYLHPTLNFPAEFVEVQSHFLSLSGESNFDMEPLQPTFSSFMAALPNAFYNILAKPNINSTHSFLSTLSVIENILLVFCAIFMLLSTSVRKLSSQQKNIALFCFAFAISFYLLLGLTVSNVGAIVRYKTTGLIFMGIGLITITDLQKLPAFLRSLIKE